MTALDVYRGTATSTASPEDAALLARRRRALGPAYRLFYDKPLHLVRGEGVWLYDAQGRRYLDAYNNVASLGHCHPAVVEAISRQASLLNTNTRYLGDGVVAYAEALLATFPDDLVHVMLTCTGSEANDLAVRMARTVTGGEGLIVTQLAYHGVTASIAQASPSLGPANQIGPTVWLVPAPKSRADEAEVGAQFATGVHEALQDMRAKGVRPAALLVDTLFSSDGVFAEPRGFLTDAVAAVRAEGGLFIADEVQAGFARVGLAYWGFARHRLSPDIVTLGKPMGNGHPVAGVVARAEVTEAFGDHVRYFNTFGGNAVSAAAAMAVLTVIRNEGLNRNSEHVGSYLVKGLKELASRHSIIQEVRGAGLYVAVDLRDAWGGPASAEAKSIVNAMRDAGVLLSVTGPGANILKMRPPLVLAQTEADLLISTLGHVLTELYARA